MIYRPPARATIGLFFLSLGLACSDILTPSRTPRYLSDLAGEVFRWPGERLPVRYFADTRGTMPALVRTSLREWEAQFLYGEFSGTLVADSMAADVIVTWQDSVPPDVPPDTTGALGACDGVTSFVIDAGPWLNAAVSGLLFHVLLHDADDAVAVAERIGEGALEAGQALVGGERGVELPAVGEELGAGADPRRHRAHEHLPPGRCAQGHVADRHAGGLSLRDHLAALFGFGAEAVHPWLALQCFREAEASAEQYRSAAENGLLKILSKMGISTLQSYAGAQIFEAVGLSTALVERADLSVEHRVGRRHGRVPFGHVVGVAREQAGSASA